MCFHYDIVLLDDIIYLDNVYWFTHFLLYTLDKSLDPNLCSDCIQ